MDIAFLGLGAMGAPMTTRLVAGRRLTVWNRTQEKARSFAQRHGCEWAATPAEAARRADLVVTCLPTSSEVESVLAGTLTVMVGATVDTFHRIRPVLERFGPRGVHVGHVGAGHAMKTVNNALFAASLVAFAEAAVPLVKAWIAGQNIMNVLNGSSGRSFLTERLVPDRVQANSQPLSASPCCIRTCALQWGCWPAKVARHHCSPASWNCWTNRYANLAPMRTFSRSYGTQSSGRVPHCAADVGPLDFMAAVRDPSARPMKAPRPASVCWRCAGLRSLRELLSMV